MLQLTYKTPFHFVNFIFGEEEKNTHSNTYIHSGNALKQTQWFKSLFHVLHANKIAVKFFCFLLILRFCYDIDVQCMCLCVCKTEVVCFQLNLQKMQILLRSLGKILPNPMKFNPFNSTECHRYTKCIRIYMSCH